MGDMAEMYSEYYPDEEDREEEYASRGIWPAKTGEIPVTSMDDDHLYNALSYIKKNNLNSPLQFMLEHEIERRHTRGGNNVITAR